MCPTCHKPLTGSISRGNGGQYPYYHCSDRQCAMYGKCIAKDKLEKEFIQYLAQVTPKEKALAAIKDAVLDVWEENGMSFKLEAEKYEKQLATLLEQKTRILDFLEDGTYSREEGKERRAEMENKIMATKISLGEARIEQFDLEGAITYATNFIGDLARQWFDLSPQLRPRFQKLVFPEGLPYSHVSGYGTAKLGLIYEINHQTGGDLSQVVDLAGLAPASPSDNNGMLLYAPQAQVHGRIVK